MKLEMLKSESVCYLDVRNSKNNAIADGVSENTFEISCWDDDFYPARGIDILCRVDGKAKIKQAGSSIYHGYTDVNGLLRISLINTVEEEVTLTIEVFNVPATRQKFSSNFTANSGKLQISEVVNVNHTFRTAGEPSIAWPGAEFLIKVKGGSGEMNWKVTQSSGEISADSTADGDGRVVIRSRPRQVCQIEGEDLITREKITYNFQITAFVTTDNIKRTSDSNQGLFGNNRLRIDECDSLFNQWGNLGAYAVWNIRDDYWTNDKGIFKTTCYNFAKGTKPQRNNIERHLSIYKTGSN
ncbi:MAG: hypothetical protein RR510_06800 [Morganella sp. (in: enterobacteria)]